MSPIKTALLLVLTALPLLLQAASTTSNSNCFDYIVNEYLEEIYNDLGFTTLMTIEAGKTCDINIATGFARFVY